MQSRLTGTLIVVALAALFVLTPALAASPGDYAGTFVLDPAVDNEGARSAAVDDVVQGFSPLIRGIARRRLAAAARMSGSYTFAPDRDRMTISSDAASEWTTALDRTEIPLLSDKGEDFHLSRWMEAGSLHSNARSERGSNGNVFELSSDGQRMTVTTTIDNDRLPKTLVYRVEYLRKQ